MGRIFDLGEIDMPLPDAPDYSKRIYELLKETDLENLSYAQFQGVAEKLFIEPVLSGVMLVCLDKAKELISIDA